MTGPSADVDPDRPLPPALLALGYLLYFAAGGLAAVVTVLLVPLRIGATLFPITLLLVVIAGLGLPLLSRGLTDSLPSAAPPVIGQILTTWILSMGRPEGDVLMPAGDTAWVSYGVLILAIAAPGTMLAISSRPGPITLATAFRRPPADQAAEVSRRPSPTRRPGSGSGSGGAR